MKHSRVSASNWENAEKKGKTKNVYKFTLFTAGEVD